MEIMVSIFTTAYNHESYIADALDSFINQKTNFPFEIIVHDDASTDRTPEIIMEYAEKYPELIIPIIQRENKYSKGIDIFTEFMLPKARGKYYAFCEGDDYWCDVEKLQLQVDYLEKHPECIASGHNTLVINSLTGEQGNKYNVNGDYDATFAQVIKRSDAVYHTSSLIYRKEVEENLKKERPSYLDMYEFTDFPYAIYLACNGIIHYIDRVMSVYRIFTPGSWTDRNRFDTAVDSEKQFLEFVELLKAVDAYTNQKYTKDIRRAISWDYLRIMEIYLKASSGNLRLYTHYFWKLTTRNKLGFFKRILNIKILHRS